MSDYYEDLPKLEVRLGRTTARPLHPPDKNALFWDIQTGIMWAVNDSMEWVAINPPGTGESHVRIADIATNNVPKSLMFQASALGAFIWECRLVVSDAWDIGVTLSVGDDSDNERLMKTTDILPQAINDNFTPYKTTPMYQYGALAGIYLYQNSFSSTGAGTLYLSFDENPDTL